ncbi:putative gamma-tubulin complex component protein [Lupinus albus]|uniref:Putative gamma-tubulin complex component protein n=1 Tax=Lupinus albus TaxID=3870 RepID=A0A6A4P7G8_LUPAL|nr:putative gamma-tubulin complex component protein [Lupinus albus]
MDCRFASLFEKVDDAHPSSVSSSSSISSSSNQPPQSLSSLSESCLVALVMNAMQGLESSLITIQNISHFFSTLPPHTHNISSLWNRASTTHSFSKILHSIASIGSLVFLLRHFVNYFTNNISTLVNQAFAVALGKVLEGYISSLHTIHPSSLLRRSKNLHSPLSGCLNTILLSEFTLLEFYLHTNQLRTHIQALSTICNLHISPLTSFQDLTAQATSHFSNFYRGADLLTFLYNQLQVADPAHSTLLKFLFIRSSEPYCGFIRSWIFKAEINDPYNEFIVENMESLSPKSCDFNYGNSLDLQFSSIRVRDGVSIPAFLKDYLVPLVRAGQQLQVLLKLLGLCIHVPGDHSSDDFLPCWSGFSSNNPSHCSPLTFSRDIIEAMVVARESYYKGMNDKIESLLSSLEVRYQQVTHDMRPSFDNGGGTLGNLGQFMSEEKSIFRPTEDKARSNMGTDGLGSDVSSTVDDLSLLEDMYDSSESSSLSSSEEQLESDLLSGWFCPLAVQQNPLSALRFCKSRTLHSSIKNSRHHEKSGSDLLRIFDKMEASDNLVKSCHEEMISSNMSNPLNHEESSCSCIFSIQYRESLTDSFSAMGHLLKNSFLDDDSDGKKVNEKHLGSLRYSMLSQDICAIGDTLRGEVMSEDQPDNSTLASNWCTFQPQRFDHQCNIPGINPLSMNPMLTRNALLHQMGRNREKGKADHEQPLPYFNFSMVEDPCKVYLDKSPTNSRYSGAPSFPLDSSASTHGSKNNQCGKMGHGTEDGLVDVTEKCFDASSDSMDHKQDFSTVVSGGSSWERLLGSFRETVNCDATHKQSLVSTFEIPLDIIIDKCLLQEIMLQYKYVSKLIINVLEEAFELQEHLLALRRYHFMELADWADLFILSLWHHNWSVTEANERLSEIQGLLELSIQKSSCEQDPNKDRLFVYMKGNGKLPLSTSAIGVRSFEFLGLGYRLDWPLSIVLTPAALKIYADIFSFLIQVKLAIFSLTDVWCSLKDLVHTTDKYLNSELQQRGAGHLNILMKMRHQINHFVSTLQQYVESQLSHVSWCRFLHSLQYKVKDIMDLESVHMEYLADSLCICFLSDETRTVGSIIESILQCALDFRSCLTVGARDIGSDQEALFGMLSRINISQVLSIKQKFDRSLKELHICYINEPKHGNFGLSRFWEYLNYNEYYSHVSNEMGY